MRCCPSECASCSPRMRCTRQRTLASPAISNGEMIRRAIGAGFDLIVPLDRGIPRQQNLERSGIGFVLIPHNDLDRIRPYADEPRRALERASPGMVLRIAAPRRIGP